jgi:hypothetical protein
LFSAMRFGHRQRGVISGVAPCIPAELRPTTRRRLRQAVLNMSAILIATTISFSASASEVLDVTVRNGDRTEIAVRERIEGVVEKYKLQRWLYTRRIVIDKSTWPPHSHPVLTLGVNERFLHDDKELVAALLHEQFHWNMSLHSRLSPRQSLPLVKLFLPSLRTTYPYGSDDELSTYAHVLVCYMEYRALSSVFGKEMARAYLSKQPFYTDVYAAVLNEAYARQIEAVLARAGVTYQ